MILEIDDVVKEKEMYSVFLNIMILIFDGMFIVYFKRLLLKMYVYFRDGLDFIFFKGYFIVGELIILVMIVFLIGKLVLENCEFKEVR